MSATSSAHPSSVDGHELWGRGASAVESAGTMNNAIFSILRLPG
jgi:hypothetical protein